MSMDKQFRELEEEFKKLVVAYSLLKAKNQKNKATDMRRALGNIKNMCTPLRKAISEYKEKM
jgi:hypothetical protein